MRFRLSVFSLVSILVEKELFLQILFFKDLSRVFLLRAMGDELLNLWANLSLSKVEDGELEIQSTVVKEVVQRGQLCIVGKLVSERMISKEIIKNTLMRLWRFKRNFTFKVLAENLFLIEFEVANDKIRVLEGRPWDFEGNLFLVEDFDGRTSPLEFTFDKASFWVQMMNLPLACMSREVGFKLGASVRKVEEVGTEKDGIGWGEYLRVKILIDLYKPLSRGRMLKFDGKSTLIGFKFERLPKFCYHCGVIHHGEEGCLKRNRMRNQGVLQFGPWLRASSPTRRMEKIHERMAGNMDSAKFSQAMLGAESRREGHQNKRGCEWKMRTVDSGGDERNGGPVRGKKSSQVLHGESKIRGKNHRDNYETFQNKPVQVKE